jgi:polyphosphate glucokinase
VANSELPYLVIDIGGTSVKLLVSGQHERRMFPSGPKMMPDKMVRKTLEMVADWDYSVVSIGYPGPVLRGRPISEPYNLGAGWAVLILPLRSAARSRS